MSLWNANRNRISRFAIALIPVRQKVCVVIACRVTEKRGNFPHAISRRISKKHMTAPLKTLYGFTKNGEPGGKKQKAPQSGALSLTSHICADCTYQCLMMPYYTNISNFSINTKLFFEKFFKKSSYTGMPNVLTTLNFI